MCAPPGSRIYGVPSAKLAWFAAARRAGSVGRAVFWPVPRVDSGLVALIRLCADEAARCAARPPRGGVRRRRCRVLAAPQDAALGAGALGRLGGGRGAAVRAAGVDPALRGEALGIGDFARIARVRRSLRVKLSAPVSQLARLATAAGCQIRSSDRDLRNQASSRGRHRAASGEGQSPARRRTGSGRRLSRAGDRIPRSVTVRRGDSADRRADLDRRHAARTPRRARG